MIGVWLGEDQEHTLCRHMFIMSSDFFNYSTPMIGENRQLVINEPVEFEK